MLSHPAVTMACGRTGSVVRVLLGAVLVASIVRGSANVAYVVGLLVFGTSLVVLGVVLPRLRNAEVGPATGFKLTLDEDRAVPTRLAECEQVERPRSTTWWSRPGSSWRAEVSDETYGLTPSQQRRARDLAVVAAMPVPNASDEVIAVLAGSSVDARSGLGSDAGFDAHLLLARVLVDLLGWFPEHTSGTSKDKEKRRLEKAMPLARRVPPATASPPCRPTTRSRALAEGTTPIRLTAGQRLAIINSSIHAGAAGA